MLLVQLDKERPGQRPVGIAAIVEGLVQVIQTAQRPHHRGIQIHLQAVKENSQLHGLGQILGRTGSQCCHIFRHKAVTHSFGFLCPAGKAIPDGLKHRDTGGVIAFLAGVLPAIGIEILQHTGHTHLHQKIPIGADMAMIRAGVGGAGIPQHLGKCRAGGVRFLDQGLAAGRTMLVHNFIMGKSGDELILRRHRQRTLAEQQSDQCRFFLHDGQIALHDLHCGRAKLLFGICHSGHPFALFAFIIGKERASVKNKKRK